MPDFLCAKIEHGLAYPRFVANKKMPQDKADREIAVMRCVLATLEALKP